MHQQPKTPTKRHSFIVATPEPKQTKTASKVIASQPRSPNRSRQRGTTRFPPVPRCTQDFQIMYTGVDTVLSQKHDNPRVDAVLPPHFISLSKNAGKWPITCSSHECGGTSNGTGPN